MRQDVAAINNTTSLEEYTQSALGVSQFLRQNVLQAALEEQNDGEIWSSCGHASSILETKLYAELKIREEALGDNDSIKSPPPIPESSRQARKRAKMQK